MLAGPRPLAGPKVPTRLRYTTASMSPRRKRTIVVTGSASGIGAAVRERFVHSGARVIGVDQRNADVIADLADGDGRKHAVDVVLELCDGRLDGVVVCAGLGPHVQPVSTIVRVNYFGALAMLDGLLPALEAGDAAAAAAVASNSAGITPVDQALLDAMAADDEASASTRAEGIPGATVYGMSKLALARAIRRRAKAWGRAGVRLNAVAPGPVDTPLLAGSLQDPTLGPLVEALPVPVGRRATPAEIAGALAFLLDPANGYIHGAVLFVDGGSDAQLRPDSV